MATRGIIVTSRALAVENTDLRDDSVFAESGRAELPSSRWPLSDRRVSSAALAVVFKAAVQGHAVLAGLQVLMWQVLEVETFGPKRLFSHAGD